MDTKLNTGGSLWTPESTFSLWGQLSTGTGCSVNFGVLRPWRYWKAIYSRASCPRKAYLLLLVGEITQGILPLTRACLWLANWWNHSIRTACPVGSLFGTMTVTLPAGNKHLAMEVRSGKIKLISDWQTKTTPNFQKGEIFCMFLGKVLGFLPKAGTPTLWLFLWRLSKRTLCLLFHFGSKLHWLLICTISLLASVETPWCCVLPCHLPAVLFDLYCVVSNSVWGPFSAISCLFNSFYNWPDLPSLELAGQNKFRPPKFKLLPKIWG